MKTLSTSIQGLDTSPIRKAFELAATLENPINLSIGQPHFACPQNIIEALTKAANDGKTAYTLTGGIPELKEALVRKYETVNKIKYATPSRILVTSGISSALLLLFSALVNPGDECLIISPYFLMYPSMLKFHGAKIHLLDEKFTKEDTKKLKFSNLKLIIYSNPSNPTGYVMTKEQLEALADLAEVNDAYLISDEIYELFDYDKKFLSVGSFYEKAITLSGFSKTYSMTGLRLASILASEEITKVLTTLQQYTIVCAPSVTQYAGIEALKTDMSSYIKEYKENRDYVYDSLKDYYELDKSAGAFYFFLKVKGNDEEFVKKAVLEKKLITVPGFIFNNSHSYIRISFANTKENLTRGINALKELA
ncbi:MAG TPA: aminotransferase class I/II-fold pyridoxal phosphate-dependent enzyme [Leptospiraceae bacterium]|nr:aminotransferase class I/II-fold pyridoxal phosphate-dependent enzyme [Leptospiraceae bacterium]HMW05388.1 aminotransferase class I/II-fold pyridoxal phosphate-dependent enzyme [Leptospiraceae bacterium]HMX32832.1 aminotransferase class I/II-fold pyridoxal phosphate-dependent enzyme [Leptospiraceae bacterium]HMY33872.1 aminotransferase class I/II-fold pyridoxal phosphate-dependent enzyme [Leptospiraceae bacterium]HMZ64490.1 aminotransferase class I/II-fold pyridoxal phosphate-dependent enzym